MEKGESRLQQLQEGVEETKGIMVENYNKVIDRGVKLEDMDERAEAMLESSKRFQKTSRKLKVKAEAENSRMSSKKFKMIMIIAGVVLFIIIIIIIIRFSWPT
ncbi:vesicle-associated membrane protein 5 [Tachysurus ichikawai]